MNAIVIEGKEYHFKMAHPENTEEILSLYQSAMGTEGCTWDETDLSQLIQTYEVLGKTIDRDVIAQYIQHKMIAKDFANQALFIIEDNAHKIAGAISIDEDTEVNALTCWSKQLEPSAELARLVIREAEQNHGLARIMIQKTMEELKKSGMKGVHFLVSKTNERAMRSYQKLNFTKCGESDLYGENWWCYEKAL